MTSLLQAQGLTSENNLENILKIFQSLDSNRDGQISEDEFMNTFLKYEYLVWYKELILYIHNTYNINISKLIPGSKSWFKTRKDSR